MDNDKLKNIPITTLLLTYLFVCGILYLIGFWSTFEIDVFSLISIYDIPKSFAFPLLISQGFFVLNLITGNFFDFEDERENRKHLLINIDPKWKPTKRFFLGLITLIDLWVILPIYLMTFFMADYQSNSVFWLISSLLVAYYLLHKFINLEILKKTFRNKLIRFFIGHFIVFFPISCFSTGKISSLEILKNKKTKFVTFINTDNNIKDQKQLHVKLLGFISDKILVSTLDNKKVRTYPYNGIRFVHKLNKINT